MYKNEVFYILQVLARGCPTPTIGFAGKLRPKLISSPLWTPSQGNPVQRSRPSWSNKANRLFSRAVSCISSFFFIQDLTNHNTHEAPTRLDITSRNPLDSAPLTWPTPSSPPYSRLRETLALPRYSRDNGRVHKSPHFLPTRFGPSEDGQGLPRCYHGSHEGPRYLRPETSDSHLLQGRANTQCAPSFTLRDAPFLLTDSRRISKPMSIRPPASPSSRPF